MFKDQLADQKTKENIIPAENSAQWKTTFTDTPSMPFNEQWRLINLMIIYLLTGYPVRTEKY